MKKIKPSERINGDEMKLEKLKFIEDIKKSFGNDDIFLQSGVANYIPTT